MIKILMTTLLTIVSIISFAQQKKPNVKQDFFNQGMAAYNNGDLKEAEEYFIKSYENNRDKNSLFNIGLVRLELNDKCSACDIFLRSKNIFGDKESIDLYNSICIREVDTTFFDKNFTRVSRNEKYRYYQEKIAHICDSIVVGLIHKKGFRGSSQILAGTKIPGIVDICATYYIVDSVKYYDYIYNSQFRENNKIIFDKYKTRMKDYLNGKYYNNMPNNPNYLTINLYIDKSGRIVKSYIQSNNITDISLEQKNKLLEEVSFSIQSIQILKPEKFMNKIVDKKFDFFVYL